MGRYDWQNGGFAGVRITDAYSANNIRAAASDDGTHFWAVGANSGVRYTTLAGGATTQLSTVPTNLRYVNIFNAQLYVSSASGSNIGVNTVGNGLPTAAGQTTTLFPGFPLTAGLSPYDFYLTPDGNTLYVADDRAVASGGGLQKWTKGSGGTFTLTYTLTTNLASGLRSVARGADVGGNPVFYATDAAALSNLVTITDTGASSTFTVLATAATNTAFRGVEVLGAGSGTVTPANPPRPPCPLWRQTRKSR